ncbi:hypothetical protein HPB51_020387 [Rhipicephalus microplus]|uniref:Uncharacterized protein n=1 Tax=Rhipicephalus microplus TaxID=6941 RepID=A0A9J6DVZ3_RHIMP|nr:hypothetical protein HPB51_020387 [Rhipicephalus microplus]
MWEAKLALEDLEDQQQLIARAKRAVEARGFLDEGALPPQATFTQVVETGGDGDEKAMVAMGVLNTLDTLVTVLEEQRELVAMLEPTLLQLLVGQVLGQSLLEFYEEALSLLYSLSCRGPLSADMWKAFEALYLAFQKDAFDFFTGVSHFCCALCTE